MGQFQAGPFGHEAVEAEAVRAWRCVPVDTRESEPYFIRRDVACNFLRLVAEFDRRRRNVFEYGRRVSWVELLKMRDDVLARESADDVWLVLADHTDRLPARESVHI